MIRIGIFITGGINMVDTKESIVNLFNSFLTNISSLSSVSKQECSSFINSRFDEMVEMKMKINSLNRVDLVLNSI